MRRVDLIFQIVRRLHQQRWRKLLRIFGLLERLKQCQRVKRDPDLRRILIDFVNRAQQRRQCRRPRFFVVDCLDNHQTESYFPKDLG